MLHQRFEQMCSNPYTEALLLTYNCLDFKLAKPKSLSYFIIEQFNLWSNKMKPKIAHLLTKRIQFSAFGVMQQQSSLCFMKLIVETYNFRTNSADFLDCIKSMIDQKQFKDACQCVMLLNLQSQFGIDEFLIPLILQDKLVCVDEFLVESPVHQTKLVTFLDSLLGENGNIRAVVDSICA